jgi:hypothetical protein
MTTRMLTVMWMLSCSVLLRAQSDDLFVNAARPIAMMAEKIEQQTSWPITYEDPSYQYAGDYREFPDKLTYGGRAFVLHNVPLVFTLDAEKRKDVVKAVRELVEEFETRSGGQKFRVIAEKGYIHIVPQLNRDKQGTWAEQRPMLDTRVSMAAGKRNLAQILAELKQEVSRSSERALYIGTMPMNLMFNTEVELPAFQNTQARAILREALSRAPVKLSWQLFGGPGDEDQFLNVHVVGTRDGDK